MFNNLVARSNRRTSSTLICVTPPHEWSGLFIHTRRLVYYPVYLWEKIYRAHKFYWIDGFWLAPSATVQMQQRGGGEEKKDLRGYEGWVKWVVCLQKSSWNEFEWFQLHVCVFRTGTSQRPAITCFSNHVTVHVTVKCSLAIGFLWRWHRVFGVRTASWVLWS